MDSFSEGLIKPDLILLLKNILDNYPDNGQILKELIQNAEDAGATEVKFLLDEGSYPTKNLYSPELERFQGPALYAYNNSEFLERDWKGICLLYDSIKKDNSNTIGRFGVGFKSVFHMTDFPGILSGYGIGFIDPYERYFSSSRTGDKSSCKLWNFKNPEQQREMLTIWDQFQPYCRDIFYSGDLKSKLQNGYQSKTLFRFPLRTQQTDNITKLSDKAYSAESVKSLFTSLQSEAREILLFLPNLQKVGAYVKAANGAISPFFSVCKTKDNIPISRGISDLDINRLLFHLISIKVRHSKNSIDETKFWTFLYDCPMSDFKDLKDVKSISSKFGVASRVGLAINLSEIKNLSKANITAVEWPKNGQLFCFLPLPQGRESATGFAFHIHASFIVDQNRSKIKMPPSQGDIGEDLKWNSYLINRAIPDAMVSFCKTVSILKLSAKEDNLCISTEDKLNILYTLMPHPACVRKDWEPTMREFYNIVFSSAYNTWLISAENAQHTGINANTYFALWTEDNHTDRIISAVLRVAKQQVIYVSENVLIALRNSSCELVSKEITPNKLSLVLKQNDIVSTLPDATRFTILSYLLSDVILDNTNVSEILNRLEGLELIPLENRTWTTLQVAIVCSECVFVSSINHSIDLLPGLEERFLKEDISQDLKNTFTLIASTERTQLRNIDRNTILNLLHLVKGLQPSPDVIKRYKKAKFNDEYLCNLWKYIKLNKVDLRFLEEKFFHIIPMNSSLTEMILLSSRLPLLIGNESVNQKVVQCCQGMGIIVLEYFPGYIRDCGDIVGKYAFPFNPNGISECIRRIGEHEAASKLHSGNRDLRIAFRKFLEIHVRPGTLSPDQMKVFRHLPLFEIANCHGLEPTYLASVESVSYAVDANFSSRISLSSPTIQIVDEKTLKFAKLIGIKLHSATDILKLLVLPKIRKLEYNAKETEQIMITIFQDFSSILDNKDFLEKNIRDLPFIPTTSGKLVRACDLFDTNDSILASLFLGGDKFPSGELAADEFRPILIRLGLKSINNMAVVDIVAAAELVSKDPDDDKCTSMMQFVENIGENVFKNGQNVKQKEQLQKYAWVSEESAPPENYPVGLQFCTGYSAPSQVCSSKYCKIVASMRPTVDTDKWPILSKLFGWCNVPPLEDIINHLCNTIEYYNNNSALTNDINNVVSNVQDITESVYCEMNKLAQQKSLTQECVKRLTDIPCIFIEGTFIFPDMCSKDYDRGQECMPWICGLPHRMKKKFKLLFEFLQIKDKFDIEDFLRVLQNVHDKKTEVPLDDTELKIVLNVAKDLASSIRSSKFYMFNGKDIYLPDIHCILRKANTLWLRTPTTFIAEDEFKNNFECHRGVSHEDGKILGIATTARLAISEFTRPFGQCERLTNRIRRLLQTTPFGIETFKELIQNADDAGATEVQIILDPRQLPCDKVFNENWKLLQGPALSIYNNKPFTSKDLEGIQSFGEGSKEHELATTGQYGVGFNAVYHLTDVPSILTTVDTERVLCVFDPTQKFICESKETGIQFCNIEQLKSKFPDSFVGYLEEEFSKTGGSLMRLPLRIGSSDLADATPGVEFIERCLFNLRDEFSLQLLFVDNITQISVKKINSTNSLETLYSLKSEKLDLRNLPFTEFDDYLVSYKNFVRFIDNRSNQLENSSSREVFYKLRLKNHIIDSTSVTEYLVVQTFGFRNINSIPKYIVELHLDGNLTVLPKGGVAFQLPSKVTESEDHALSSKLFCNLPIPGELKLPVHVNGCFYLDHDNRRSLLNEVTFDKRAGWNSYLMENVISQIYVKLLHEVKGMTERKELSVETYMMLFPYVSEIDSYPESVIAKALYRTISSLKLLPVQRMSDSDPILWLDPPSGYIDIIKDQQINLHQSSENQRHVDTNLLKIILRKCGLYLFEKKSNLFQNFFKSKVTLKESSPENILSFYQTKDVNVFRSCVSSDYKISSELFAILNILNYCQNCSNFKSLLERTPLLVTQDGTVTRYDSKNKIILSKSFRIAPHAPYEFVHHEIVSDLSLLSKKQGKGWAYFSRLTVLNFLAFLQSLFGKEKSFSNGQIKFIPMSLLAVILQPYKDLLSDSDYHFTWLKETWKFLEKEVNSLTKFKKISEDKMEKETFARNSITVLGNWHLFPVCLLEDGGSFDEYLMSVSSCYGVMSQDYLKKHLATLHPILLKMKMPFILSKSEIYDGCDNKLITMLTGMDTCSTSRLLISALNSLNLEKEGSILLREEQRTILTYLDTYLEDYKNMEVAKTTIRRLPFYMTIEGHLTCLKSGHKVFILPRASTIPDFDLKSCVVKSGNSKTIILRNDGYSDKLFQFLDCIILTEAELYLEFILKSLPSMPNENGLRHLEYIRDKLFCQEIELKFESQLESMLSRLAFIADPRYEFHRKAEDYYNPRIELFKNMDDFCTFPPKPFYDEVIKQCDDRWISFLIKCGLVSKVDECQIIKFASDIQNKFITVTNRKCNEFDRNKLLRMSDFLLQFIANNSELISETLWVRLRKIKFIAAHRRKNGDSTEKIICLMDSYLYKVRYLVFTLGNILPNSLDRCCSENELQLLCSKAGIKTEPSEDDVVHNLENLHVLGENSNENQIFKSDEKLQDICIASFKFLNNLIFPGSLKESNAIKLMHSPCIVVNTDDGFVFVQPKNVVLSAYCQLHPYLYILPHEYKAFSSLMLSLGIKDEATSDRYIYVLSEIKSNYNEGLPSSALQMANEAIKGLYLKLSPNMDKDYFVNNTLYLPGYFMSQECEKSDNPTLHKSNEIAVFDCKIETERLLQYTRPLFGWSFNKTHDFNQEIFQKKLKYIPLQYRPKFFSHVIQERLIVEDTVNYSSQGKLQKKFRSKRFHHAILRLAVHSHTSTGDDDDDSEILSSLQTDLTCLKNFRVLVCETIETELYDTFDEKNQCKIDKSKANVPYFFNDATVYLSKNVFDKVSKDVLNIKLAEVLNRITKNRLTNVMHKIPPILNCEPNMMRSCLDEMDVPKIDLDKDEDSYDEDIEDDINDESPSVENSQTVHQPDLALARVWLEQAEQDLKSAEKDVLGDDLFYEWSCYKCHQASEKAIKAILLATTGLGCMEHNLSFLVLAIPNSDMKNQWVIDRLTAPSSSVENLTRGHCAMRYPYGHQNPHDRFKSHSTKADEIKRHSNVIVEASQEFLRRAS